MVNLNWWSRSLMVAGVASFAILAARPWQVRSAEPAQLQQAGQYYGSGTCKGCHDLSPATPSGFPGAKEFIRLDEWTIWDKDDKHSIAFANLTTERGRRMASLLHVDDVTKAEVGCLGCHSASAGRSRIATRKGRRSSRAKASVARIATALTRAGRPITSTLGSGPCPPPIGPGEASSTSGPPRARPTNACPATLATWPRGRW